MTSCMSREDTHAGKLPGEDGGRDWSDASTCHGGPAATRGGREQSFPSKFQREQGPSDPLDFRLLTSKMGFESAFWWF